MSHESEELRVGHLWGSSEDMHVFISSSFQHGILVFGSQVEVGRGQMHVASGGELLQEPKHGGLVLADAKMAHLHGGEYPCVNAFRGVTAHGRRQILDGIRQFGAEEVGFGDGVETGGAGLQLAHVIQGVGVQCHGVDQGAEMRRQVLAVREAQVPVLAHREVGGAHVGARHDHVVVEHEGLEMAHAHDLLHARGEHPFQYLVQHRGMVEGNAHGILGAIPRGGFSPGSSVGEQDVGQHGGARRVHIRLARRPRCPQCIAQNCHLQRRFPRERICNDIQLPLLTLRAILRFLSMNSNPPKKWGKKRKKNN